MVYGNWVYLGPCMAVQTIPGTRVFSRPGQARDPGKRGRVYPGPDLAGTRGNIKLSMLGVEPAIRPALGQSSAPQ